MPTIVAGLVVDHPTRHGAAELHVEAAAMDPRKSIRPDDASKGSVFQIDVEEERLHKVFQDRTPEDIFKVLCGQDLVATTEDTVNKCDNRRNRAGN